MKGRNLRNAKIPKKIDLFADDFKFKTGLNKIDAYSALNTPELIDIKETKIGRKGKRVDVIFKQSFFK